MTKDEQIKELTEALNSLLAGLTFTMVQALYLVEDKEQLEGIAQNYWNITRAPRDTLGIDREILMLFMDAIYQAYKDEDQDCLQTLIEKTSIKDFKPLQKT